MVRFKSRCNFPVY